MSWENRANIFLKAADLMATKYRPYMNGTTMLGQSKNAYQAEIDSACELIDFLRFNVHFLSEIYKQQPISHRVSITVWSIVRWKDLYWPLHLLILRPSAVTCPLSSHVRQYRGMETCQYTDIQCANVHAHSEGSRFAGWCYQPRLC